ncbi:calcium/sodium antiporter [Alkalibaculum sp. M08DMB]|uniref:Calcium/sodium antiporter n=1 Tax=Alkalibaculum sporogenes TaxID=2655001 RepID=A0A6A7K5F1_9FIRM|nr:calcium/sodium antiporter [Alkalibaculum sporogenes]MPW24497.1 calcium/sodium antiporter [Alkalibaculum sporogenes]
MDKLIYSIFEQTNTLLLLFVIIGSLFTLSKGADLFVDEAVSLSIRWGIPKLIIGATIVSLGTTLPEASVGIIAALNGNSDLALGNAVGSTITNTSFILGLAAIVGTLPIDMKTISKQGSILFLCSILLVFISLPVFYNGITGMIYQHIGWLFLLLLLLYIQYLIKSAKKSNEFLSETLIEVEDSSLVIQLLKFFIGISIVILSSSLLIPAVEVGALRVGIPQSVVASTLVAFGTSLPELITAITAVRKNHGELAFGNIIGANILNILFVIGSAAAISHGGLLIPQIYYTVHYPTMLIVLFIIGYFAKNKRNKHKTLTKMEGLCLLSLYGVYLVLNYS